MNLGGCSDVIRFILFSVSGARVLASRVTHLRPKLQNDILETTAIDLDQVLPKPMKCDNNSFYHFWVPNISSRLVSSPSQAVGLRV